MYQLFCFNSELYPFFLNLSEYFTKLFIQEGGCLLFAITAIEAHYHLAQLLRFSKYPQLKHSPTYPLEEELHILHCILHIVCPSGCLLPFTDILFCVNHGFVIKVLINYYSKSLVILFQF